MRNERRRWLLRMIEATARAEADVGAKADPFQRGLLTDLVELHARLVAELDALEGTV